jgi:hypothetical protein
MKHMEILGGLLCVCVGPIGLLWLLGHWILGPLDQAAKRRRGPTQFTMLDFLCLVFLIQLPMGLLQATLVRGTELEGTPGAVLYAVGAVIGGLMWWLSVKQLSGAGVTRTRQRGIFLAVVLPVAFFGSIAAIILSTAVIAECADWGGEIINSRPRALRLAVMLAVLGALAIAFFASAQYTRRIVVESELASDPPADVQRVVDRQPGDCHEERAGQHQPDPREPPGPQLPRQ